MFGVVIVGAGLAGARCAERLRSGGYADRIRMIGEEPVARTAAPRSQRGSSQRRRPRRSPLRSQDWWMESGIELTLGRRVEQIDPARRSVRLQGGSEIRSNTLVVATGSRARRLPSLPGARASIPCGRFRTPLSSEALLRPGRRLVVVGAGFLGTEVASTANALGVAVTLVDPSPPLARVLGDEIARLLAKRYRDHGIDLRVGVTLDRIDVAEGRVHGVRLNDGTSVASDARADRCRRGAERPSRARSPRRRAGSSTDAGGRTAFDDVYACGDAARSHHPLLGEHVRLEHWTDAAAQGSAVAETILGVDPARRELPVLLDGSIRPASPVRGPCSRNGLAWSWTANATSSRPSTSTATAAPLAALVANRPHELGRLRRDLSDARPRAA